MSLSENVFLRIQCSKCGDHGPFEVSRYVVLNNSHVLGQRLMEFDRDHATTNHPFPHSSPTNPSLVLEYAGHGYDCRLLDSIISTWKHGMYAQVSQPDLEPFSELLQLARALWEYKCSLRGFEPFANRVRAVLWEQHCQAGSQSQAWAFIAVVFGWKDVFGAAVMDIPELADDDPQPQQPQNQWRGLFEIPVLRYIVPPTTYRTQRTAAYNFIRNACCKLEYDASHKALSTRLRNRFDARGFKIILDEEDNAKPLRAAGAARLLGLFESFLRNPGHTGTAVSERGIHRPAPRNLRFQHQPLLWRAVPNLTRRFRSAAGAAGEDDEDPVAETQLRELREFRETKFMPQLFADMENRFELARATRLILPKGPGNVAVEPFDIVVELPGA